MGRRCRLAREKAGLSQKDSAEQLGVARGTLQGWEAGRHQPNASQLRALCTLYVCSPYWIFYGKRRIALTDEEREELLSSIADKSVGLRLKVSMVLTLFGVED